MIKVKVPGKLYIGGEYSVVQPGHKAILIAVDRFIKVRIQKSESIGSISSFNNLKVTWTRENKEIILDDYQEKFTYVKSAIEIVDQYLKDLGHDLDYYDIEIESELEDEDGIKYGLGSSGAVVIGVIKAILEYYKIPYSKMDLFKLSSIASLLVSPQTSCGDIAAGVYTGLVKYRSFSRKDILEKYKNQGLLPLIKDSWPLLEIKKLKKHTHIDLLVGWTKSPASTPDMVRKTKKEVSSDFLKKSDQCVELLAVGLEKVDFDLVEKAISENRELLNKFAKENNIVIETKALQDLIKIANHHGLASKSSGAGGGDCGIALGKTSQSFDQVEQEWKEKNIRRLNLNIHEESDE